MKNKRQNLILEIIQNRDIETQHQLMAALRAKGISTTQATLSRDIKQLRLVKELAPMGGYRYVAAARGELSVNEERLRTIFQKSVTSFDVAQNLIVLKTLPGMANAAAYTLDSIELADLVGTLAGDDTVFVAMRSNEAAQHFCQVIAEML